MKNDNYNNNCGCFNCNECFCTQNTKCPNYPIPPYFSPISNITGVRIGPRGALGVTDPTGSAGVTGSTGATGVTGATQQEMLLH